MKFSAHQHLQISHNLRRASGRAVPPLKTKLLQMANTHLALARLAMTAEEASPASARLRPKIPCSPDTKQLQRLVKARGLTG
jgi:hypothetical protein